MKFTVAAAFVVLMVASADSATAQRYTNYPFCAVFGRVGRSIQSCAFNTWAQCQMDVSGRGGYCIRNEDYQPQGKRKHRR